MIGLTCRSNRLEPLRTSKQTLRERENHKTAFNSFFKSFLIDFQTGDKLCLFLIKTSRCSAFINRLSSPFLIEKRPRVENLFKFNDAFTSIPRANLA